MSCQKNFIFKNYLIFKNEEKLVGQKNVIFKNYALLIGKYLLDKSAKI